MKKQKFATILMLMIVLLFGCANKNDKPDDVSVEPDDVSVEIETNLLSDSEDVQYPNEVQEVEDTVEQEGDEIYILMEKYINFMLQHNHELCYLIYDIDKDKYPELFIENQHTGNAFVKGRALAYDIYTFTNNEFGLLDTWYGSDYDGEYPDIYASYPIGNGILIHGCVWGNETLALCSLNEGKFEEELVYEGVVNDSLNYYKDEEDKEYKDSYLNNSYINHQYYKSEESSPYLEDSYLLAQSAVDDFTAVYEAFGVEEKDFLEFEERRYRTDLYNYRYADIYDVVATLGGLSQLDEHSMVDVYGVLFGASNSGDPDINIAVFEDDIYGTGINYIGIFCYCEYSLGGIRVGENVSSATEKVLALGYELREEEMETQGMSKRRYGNSSEYMIYSWNESDGQIKEIIWGIYH